MRLGIAGQWTVCTLTKTKLVHTIAPMLLKFFPEIRHLGIFKLHPGYQYV